MHICLKWLFAQQVEFKSAGINISKRRNPMKKYNTLFGKIQQMGRSSIQEGRVEKCG
jgi:hypothetical protein